MVLGVLVFWNASIEYATNRKTRKNTNTPAENKKKQPTQKYFCLVASVNKTK